MLLLLLPTICTVHTQPPYKMDTASFFVYAEMIVKQDTALRPQVASLPAIPGFWNVMC
jgi:hypothetical protein